MRVEKSFSAFTLAEVLITLGIIGVVAAMTMPTLINQTNGAQYKAAYKKALSAISQAVTLNVALEDEGFAEIAPSAFLGNRMNVVKTTTAATDNYPVILAGGASGSGTNFGANNTTLYFNDSSVFTSPTTYNVDTCTALTAVPATNSQCRGFIDVNGPKGPNKETKNPDQPTDIYPVYFFDQTILPATDNATQVLYSK